MTHSNIPSTLLILAGGLGSRYAGSKQVDGVGPNGEFLLEYAIFDALKAGFDKVVLVVNSAVRETLSKRLRNQFNSVELQFVEQEKLIRNKPWGTGHAVLSAKDAIGEPFMMINADDYYGRTTFEMGRELLANGAISAENMGIIAFQLGKTLSDFGGVSRGVCKVDSNGCLSLVEEHEGIQQKEKGIYSNQSGAISLKEDVPVSMNCWLLDSSIFTHLQIGFDRFFSDHKNSETKEYYLPTAMQELIDQGKVKFHLKKSTEQWFGLTYAKDKERAKQRIASAIHEGFYPERIGNG